MKDYSFVTFTTYSYRSITKGITMNKLSSKMKFFLSRVDSRTVRLIVTLTSLVLFVLAAGAPSGLGGIGMQ
jgi:hypothetical protein